MKQISTLNKNFISSLLIKIVNLLFPIITFPYIANTLLPSGLGRVQFLFSVIHVFILVGQFGIPFYGVKKCAGLRNNKEQLSKTVQELFIVNLLFSFLVFLGFIIFIPNMQFPRLIIVLFGFQIVINSFNFSWVLESLELFKIIAVRGILVKIFLLSTIFLLVKDSNDLILYSIIYLLSMVMESLINFLSAIKHVSIFKNYKHYNFSQHLKPLFSFFLFNVSTLLYLEIDKITLGIISTEVQVGYYLAANKFVKLVYSLITSITPVLLPRISYYMQNGVNDSKKIIKNAFNFFLFLAIPSTVGIFITSDLIVSIFFDISYNPSIVTMMILSPLILIITLSTSAAFLVLIPMGKTYQIALATWIGAIINLILNAILIPFLESNGAALSTVISELVITIILIIMMYKASFILLDIKRILLISLLSSTFFLISILVRLLLFPFIITFLLIVVTCTLVYLSFSLSKFKLLKSSIEVFK